MAGEKEKILIVEDNNDCRELLATFITLFGYDAIEADSGREAIGKAFEMYPDLILMDIYLPDIIGDIIARLKANPATRDIPVIITTALLEEPPETALCMQVPQKFWRSRLAYPQYERLWTGI